MSELVNVGKTMKGTYQQICDGGFLNQFPGSEFRNESVVNKGDMKGKKCTKCKKGKYKETSLMDDLKGVLHCDKCDDETERYVNESAFTGFGYVYIKSELVPSYNVMKEQSIEANGSFPIISL